MQEERRLADEIELQNDRIAALEQGLLNAYKAMQKLANNCRDMAEVLATIIDPTEALKDMSDEG